MARKIEMHWACSSCQTRNLGRHKKCQNCGNPKDGSEPWLMPDDPGSAPTVSDPELLQQANAGADWRCGYCGSYQRRDDGACAQCGATQAAGTTVGEGGAPGKAGPQPAPLRSAAYGPVAARQKPKKGLWARILAGLAAVTAPCLGCCGLGYFVDPPLSKPVSMRAEVATAQWTRIAHVERRQLVDEEGFVETRPDDALEIRSLGQAHHHDEQVFDRWETEHYTERVPYQDTETYTDREQCGEDCRSRPQSCREVCTSDNNGFATCNDVCSGGGQTCTPRYCSVTRTRSVTRYRSESRTRQVRRFRSEPRYAERFAWRAWRWRDARDIRLQGDLSSPPRWPTEQEMAPPERLAEGEQERSQREERYSVVLRSGGRRIELQPSTAQEFDRITAHEHWHVSRDDSPELIKPFRSAAAP